jgi:hypothetical protein
VERPPAKRPLSALLFTVLGSATTLSSAASAVEPATAPELRAEHLLSERWTFRIVQEGAPKGAIVVDFFPQEDAVWVHDISTMGPDVHEDVNIILEPDTLAWRSATVGQPMTIELESIEAHTAPEAPEA